MGTEAAAPVDAGLAFEIGVEVYTWLYPMVLMDVTRRQAVNVESAGQRPGRGPAGGWTHLRAFPAGDFRDVVRPNFDTLYSIARLDLTRGPLVVSMPDAGDRYYLLPFYDMWSDIFAAPGTHTTGNGAADHALVGPGWSGSPPPAMRRIDAPTPHVWAIGRTKGNGPADLGAVNDFQDRMAITPLADWGPRPARVRGVVDPSVDDVTPPPRQVLALSPRDYFAAAADLLALHPPHAADHPIRARAERIGFVAGTPFDLAAADPTVREALERAVPAAQERMRAAGARLGWTRNDWHMSTKAVGTYGTDYLKRAAVALVGLGANLPEDAVYPTAFTDAAGQPLTGARRYTLRFAPEELPPVRAFWSLTMYDAEGFQVANDIARFAIGDRDALSFAADGSLDLHIQHEPPGADRESNWLPAPVGGFNLCLRLYRPRPEAIDGTWAPPPVRRRG